MGRYLSSASVLLEFPLVLDRVSAQSADVWGATQTGSADGSRPTAAKRARVSASLDAEHFQSTRLSIGVVCVKFSKLGMVSECG